MIRSSYAFAHISRAYVLLRLVFSLASDVNKSAVMLQFWEQIYV